jgi:DNA polymerase I-like protein with 3'-5' exonuclease and polymerase domains
MALEGQINVGVTVTPEERALAKRVTYGIIYGQTAFGLKTGLGVSQAEAKDLIADFLASFKGVSWGSATNVPSIGVARAKP